MAKKKAARPAKPTVKKRTLNPSGPGKKTHGAPFSEQDPERRLGNFATTGEHARQGGRERGIIGQSRQKTRTDKKLK